MLYRYLERGKMYVLEDDGVKSECVVTDEGNGILEIKNLATVPGFQRKGYGKELILFLEKECNADFSSLQVGTGESALTVPFYESVDLLILIGSKIFLQSIMIIQSMKMESN